MIRTVAQLPIRVLKRVLSLMDGERNAPSPAPPMQKASPPVTRPPPTPAPQQAASEKKDEPKKAAPEDAAPKKAAPKKAAAKKAAPKKAAPKKAAPKKAAPKKAAPKKAAPKKAAPKKAAPKKAAPKKAAPKKAAPKKAAPKKAAPKKAAPKKSTITVDPQDTPNPNAMKFILSIPVAETGSFSFTKEDAEINHAIAAAVIALDGVVSTFGVNDFLTVSKEPSASWSDLVPAVVDAIKDSA